jgi:hypothetical protein
MWYYDRINRYFIRVIVRKYSIVDTFRLTRTGIELIHGKLRLNWEKEEHHKELKGYYAIWLDDLYEMIN